MSENKDDIEKLNREVWYLKQKTIPRIHPVLPVI